MPVILKTPQQWLREHQRDLYYFEFSADLDNVDERNQQEAALRELLISEFPSATIELLGPPEGSGWLVGGPTTLAVDFSPEELSTFSERWEDASGKSKDPRWQCYCLSYSKSMVNHQIR